MQREQELQYKFDVRHNDQFLNKSITGVWNHSDPEIIEKGVSKRRGRKASPEWVAWVTEFHRTRKRLPETGRRISKANKGRKLTQEQAKNCGNAWRGKKQPAEMILIGNKSRTGQTFSEETRQKMRMASRHLPNPIVTCPHCDKSGGKGPMIRFHFDKCKQRK